MKVLKVLLVAIWLFPFGMYAQWTVKDPWLVSHYEINYVSAAGDNIWVSAKDQSGNNHGPMFSHSEDGGNTWEPGYITLEHNLAPGMIFGFDSFPYAFAVVYSTDTSSVDVQGVHATFDGGHSWQRQSGAFENPAAWPDIIYFWTTNWGVTIGDPVDGYFDIYTTNDLGTTWQKLPQANIPDPLPGEAAIIGNFDAVGSTIWFSTTKGRVYRSNDYGINWSVYSSPFSSFTRVRFKDNNTGWLQDVGSWESTQLAQTNDGGVTWELKSFDGPLLNWDLDYIPGSVSTLVSSGAYINNGFSMSYNGGDTWYWLDEPGVKFFKMDWLDWKSGWVGGYDENQQRAMVYVYSGPGIGDYNVSPLDIYFGYVPVGTSLTRNVTVTNLGADPVELTEIFTNIGIFSVSPSNGWVDPNGGVFNIDVTFTPQEEGVYEDWVTINSTHPDIPEVKVHLVGDGFWPSSNIIIDPQSLNETLYSGQTSTKTLSVTNNTGSGINYQMNVACEPALGTLGWNYGSTPLDADDGILAGDFDQAMFIKEFTVGEFSNATLYLGVDDGGRFWVNGNLVWDDLYGSHAVEYWNDTIDITSYLVNGVNRISGVVFNGIFNGGWSGGFDCELIVDEVAVIKRGFDNYNAPEAMWYYFGQSGQQLVPEADVNGKNWWESSYGQYDWVLLENPPVESFGALGWEYQSAPFTGQNVLGSAPDNAQFIKEFTVGDYSAATLYLGFDDGCKVWLNGNLILDYYDENHGLDYWDHEDDISGLLVNGLNRICVEVYNGIYAGYGIGGFDCQLTVDGVDVIKRGDLNPGADEARWYVYGISGQISTPPKDASQNNWYEADYGQGSSQNTNYLSDLNWNFDSTPFIERQDILVQPPDNAHFIKDFEIGEFSWAALYLAFDDGCRVWLNGNLVLDYSLEEHGMNYWDHQDNVTPFLTPGRNRISIEVLNGVYGGYAWGSFDCQLEVDDVPVIKRGDENPGQPEAIWYYYGQAGQILTPPNDFSGLPWYDKNYAIAQSTPSQFLTGFIADGMSEVFNVKIDAAGLSSGEYQTNIHFTSTATKEESDVPVNLFVNSEGYLTVAPSVVDFGDYYFGYPESVKLTLKNSGFENLYILNIWSELPGLSLDFTSDTLAPGESRILTVTLESYDEGIIFSTLNFQTLSYTNPTVVMQVLGYRRSAPDLVIENLDYMYAYLASGQTETQNLHIDNWGGSLLTFAIPQANNKNQTGSPGKIYTPKGFQPSSSPKTEAVVRDKEPVYYKDDIVDFKNLVTTNKKCGKSKTSGISTIELFNDDMENGISGWTTENYGEGTSQWHQVEFNSFSPETSWWCGNELTGTYFNRYTVREAIITPSIKLPNVESTITLEFNEWYAVEGMYDQCFVDVSLDGGNEWIRIREGNPGSSEGWITTLLDISQFYGSEIKIRFFIDTGDDVANDFPGWFVDDVRVYVNDFNFLGISPGEGSLSYYQGFDISVTFDATGYVAGYYPGFILLKTNDPGDQWFYLPAILEVYGGGYVQNLNLPAGWSGVSSYLAPENPQLDLLFSPVANDLVILQNLEGVYWPSEGINTIGDWNYLNGYSIKVNTNVALDVAGTIPDNRMIGMRAGWSLIPVLSFNPVPATDFDLLESLNIIKDVAGTGVYWPVYNINTLGDLQPGKSYLINVSGDESFEYPPLLKNSGFIPVSQQEKLVSPWNEITRTPLTHLIAIPAGCTASFAVGDGIGVFNQNGYCAGFVELQNLSQNNLITVFGDDPTTAVNDGLTEAENMIFRLMKASTSEIIDLEVTFSNEQPDSDKFKTNGISAIGGIKLGEMSVNDFIQENISIQPNPATDLLIIKSQSPVSTIEISDSKGVLFLTSKLNNQHGTELDVSSLPGGIYFVKIITSKNTVVRKIIKK